MGFRSLNEGAIDTTNASGELIYVGKAKSLRKRLASYFQPSRRQTADVKLRCLINSIDDYELFSVSSEEISLNGGIGSSEWKSL